MKAVTVLFMVIMSIVTLVVATKILELHKVNSDNIRTIQIRDERIRLLEAQNASLKRTLDAVDRNLSEAQNHAPKSRNQPLRLDGRR